MYKTSLLLLNFCLYLYITNLHNVLERVSCSYLHKISRIECHSYFVIVCYLAVPLSAEFQLREVYPELLDAVADCISYEFIEVGLELGFKVEQILQFRNAVQLTTTDKQGDAEGMAQTEQAGRKRHDSMADALPTEHQKRHRGLDRDGRKGCKIQQIRMCSLS